MRRSARAIRVRLLTPTLLALACALSACGAKVDAYDPTLTGIRNEGAGQGQGDVSFVDGTDIVRAADDACGTKWSMEVVPIQVANQYRHRTVALRSVGPDCQEYDVGTVPPGETVDLTVGRFLVLRVYDAADGALVNAWLINIDALQTDRIVLRSGSPDV